MSLSNDIADVEDAIKRGHKIKPATARYALKAFGRIIARLNQAEANETRYVEIGQAFATLRYYAFARGDAP